MCVSGFVPSSAPEEPPLPPCPTLRRLLMLAGAKPNHRVCVAGPKGLSALLLLCRMGFAEACCVNGPTSSCGDAPCDVLLLTGPLSREAFVATLAAAAPRLKLGGVLAAEEGGLQDDALIQHVLAGAGREVGWRVHDLAGGCLVAMEVLRSSRPALLQAA